MEETDNGYAAPIGAATKQFQARCPSPLQRKQP